MKLGWLSKIKPRISCILGISLLLTTIFIVNYIQIAIRQQIETTLTSISEYVFSVRSTTSDFEHLKIVDSTVTTFWSVFKYKNSSFLLYTNAPMIIKTRKSLLKKIKSIVKFTYPLIINNEMVVFNYVSITSGIIKIRIYHNNLLTDQPNSYCVFVIFNCGASLWSYGIFVQIPIIKSINVKIIDRETGERITITEFINPISIKYQYGLADSNESFCFGIRLKKTYRADMKAVVKNSEITFPIEFDVVYEIDIIIIMVFIAQIVLAALFVSILRSLGL